MKVGSEQKNFLLLVFQYRNRICGLKAIWDWNANAYWLTLWGVLCMFWKWLALDLRPIPELFWAHSPTSCSRLLLLWSEAFCVQHIWMECPKQTCKKLCHNKPQNDKRVLSWFAHNIHMANLTLSKIFTTAWMWRLSCAKPRSVLILAASVLLSIHSFSLGR